MKDYIAKHPWKIIEDHFNPDHQRISESIFSIGNGRMGQRANFEEDYTGDSLQGSYLAGIYYPDKTRVGWWKIGYPEYFAKVLNSVNWIGLHIKTEDGLIDLQQCQILDFKRTLDMQKGLLYREVKIKTKKGFEFEISSTRFYHYKRKDLAFLKYDIRSINYTGELNIESYLDFDISNEDSNYDEKFWIRMGEYLNGPKAMVKAKTKKTEFEVCAGMQNFLFKNDETLKQPGSETFSTRDKLVSQNFITSIAPGDRICLIKHVAIVSSFYYGKSELLTSCERQLDESVLLGFEQARKEQIDSWLKKWQDSDILIEGDVSAQQAIRFNIFQLNQTYTGDDDRLNIGPKGFTGEKYGGSTYWDTEAYCLPFYLSTADAEVARSLLVYRYKHLPKAIENAEKLGFTNGAALYPMVTMNGEECHNEWEITFEEIHRNGAIAYAIYDYIRYTNDWAYLGEHGLEVLVGIARFWAQRVNFSEAKKKYVILGVTGPNEYENNINNNWYTNYIARWCLSYTEECLQYLSSTDPSKFSTLCSTLDLNMEERDNWKSIRNNIYLPEDQESGIFLQQDGYLDKEQVMVKDLDPTHLPINQHWSWDRILRSCFIKQADVLQGMYFFEEDFSKAQLQQNFDFYEPRTVHESSLSPCIHAIIASQLDREEKAYEMYVRTARLDLDDYNNDTEDGLHITSMAGTWLSIVKGFAGMRVKDNHLHLSPFIPRQWDRYAFEILFRGNHLEISVSKEHVQINRIQQTNQEILEIYLYDQKIELNKSIQSEMPLSHI